MSWPEWCLLGLAGAVAAAVVLVIILPWIIRPLLRVVLGLRYGFRVAGADNVPAHGPVLLASNHVSWFDGFFLSAVIPRHDAKALINADYIDVPVLRWVARRAGLIAVPTRGPQAHRRAFAAVQDALSRGELVLIFPEAQLTRNGLLGPFYRGIEVMLRGFDSVPVVPVFLDGVWGSVASHSGGCFFKKWPRGLRRTVLVAFGPPVAPPRDVFAIRQAVQATGVRAFALRTGREAPLETLDPSRPRWNHPELGLLAASTADFHRDEIHQTGQKPGSVGQPVPGVALRAVGPDGGALPPDAEGRLEALLPGRASWIDTGCRGRLDRTGFVWLADTETTGEEIGKEPGF